MSREGLLILEALTPWEQIASINKRHQETDRLFKETTEVEEIVLLRKGFVHPWVVIPVAEMPNAFLFLKLARELNRKASV